MSIRGKAFLVFLALFLLLLAVFFTCSAYYILGGFKQLERMAMATDLQRLESAVHARLQGMSRTAHDWSSWDETYDYVRGDNPDFLQVNLPPEVFPEQDVNIILILNMTGAIVWGMAYDLSNESMRELSSEEAHVLAALPFQRFGDSQGQISGIVRLPASLLLVAARPIVMHSAESPAAGALLMGRYVDEDVISHVSSMTALNARIHPLGTEDPEAGVSRFVATERVGLALSHLLDNALKFSDSGPVRIEAWHIAGPPDGPGHILCCVRDNGVGMPEEMIEHFMRPFTQQDESNSRRHGGAGLGLSIACRLVPLMGGFLQFETAPAMGASACFTISAPRAEA